MSLTKQPAMLLSAAVVALAIPVAAQPYSNLEVECIDLGARITERGIEANSGSTQFFLIVCGALVAFMQAGFGLLEAGSVQTNAVTNILFKNLADIIIGALTWWSLGYAFAYGQSSSDFIGDSGYFLQNIGLCEYAFFFYQWTFAATATTIISGAMAGRTQLKAYLIYAIVMTGFIYPTIVKWTWSYNAWLYQGEDEDGAGTGTNLMGYRDFAGSGIVHTCGGTAALIGAYLVGPRAGWSKDTPIPAHSIPLVFIGTMILFFGFLGFNGGSVLALDSTADAATAGLAIVNTVIAASGGGMATVMVVRVFGKRWSFLTMCNGAIAGMVAICAAADSVWPWAAFFIGVCGALAFKGVSNLLVSLSIDDAIDAVGVHLGGGVVGVLLRPLFDKADGLFYGHGKNGWTMLAWGVAGLVVIIVWTALWSGICFKVLSVLGYLRVDDEHQTADGGIDKKEHGEDSYSLNEWTPSSNGSKPSNTKVEPV